MPVTLEERSRDGSGEDDDGANSHGHKRKNDSHARTSGPATRTAGLPQGGQTGGQALLYRENRHALAVAGDWVTHADGTAELKPERPCRRRDPKRQAAAWRRVKTRRTTSCRQSSRHRCVAAKPPRLNGCSADRYSKS